jgi:hypothetical protein
VTRINGICRTCRCCTQPLTIFTNWQPSRARRCDYICKACNTSVVRAWRNENPDAMRTINKKSRRKYQDLNPERVIASRRKWRDRNPDVLRSQKSRRRAHERSLLAASTPQERADVRNIYSMARLAEQFTGTVMHVDHRQPIALGGSSLAENLQHLPARINLAKRDLSHEEALERVEKYAAWVNGPPTYEQVAYRVQLFGSLARPPQKII